MGHWNLRTAVRISVIGICLAGVVWVVVYLVRTGLRVKEIQVIGAGMQMEVNERLLSTNLLFFPSGKIRADLLHNYPQFKDIKIIKKFPDTIQIMPVMRSPILLIETSDTSYGVDDEGVVVDVGVIHTDIPLFIVDIPAPHMGTKITDERVTSTIAFYAGTKSFLPVTSFSAKEDGSGIQAKSGKTDILFSQKEDVSRTIATLQTIMAGVRIKGTMPVVIDVRFTKPVIQW